MNRFFLLQSAALALALTAGAAPVLAQTEMVQQTNPDADWLADEMRVLAADPRDMGALLSAANYSARLGDSSAAFAFLQRAEAIDPTNPRILAGRAAVLVRIERPGEALALFQDAEGRGYGATNFVSDRGFAYDLLGQPGMAQRDYRQALQRGGDDETIRRYALSLGIVGKLDEAMTVLDPLLRRSDRAAWRARAFILAMNGDVPGAERIAASMMPGSMGAGLSPFFRRLGGLSVADRAFAVHFGELTPTQARIADARLAPAMSPYVAEPRVQVAAAAPAPQPAAAPEKGKRRDRHSRRDDLAALTSASQNKPAPVQIASANPLPPPPAFVPAPLVQPVPVRTTPPPAIPAPGGSQPVRFSARPVAATPVPVPVRTAAAESNYDIDDPIAAPPRREATPPVAREPERKPEPLAAREPEPRPLPPVAREPEPQPLPAREPEPQPLPQPVPQPAAPDPKPAARVGEEDSVLAKIVDGITIPGDELNKVVEPGPDAPAPAPEPVVEPKPEPKPEPVRLAAAEPVKPVVAKPEPKKPDAKTAKLDPKTGKPDPKAKLDLKAAAKGKTPAKPDPKKIDPSRVWVQVAGGADEASLPGTWKKLATKAPALFKGRSGWTTPLRATNRILAGPFKSEDEAQGFVNQLKKASLTGFVFTSEAGQKIAKLPAK